MKVEWDKNSDAYEAVEKIVLDRFGKCGESIVVQLRMKYNEPEEDYETSELLLNDGEDWLHPVWIWENRP